MTSAKGESADERRLRMIVEASPNAMAMIDPAGQIVMVNTQLRASMLRPSILRAPHRA